jgi:plastocyanin
MRSARWLVAIAAVSASPLAAMGNGDDFTLRGSVRTGQAPAAQAAVWLTAPGRSASVPSRNPVLDQRNLSFSPRMLVVQVGDTVELPNSDRVLHNVFSFRDGKRFDLGLYPVGAVRRVTFDRAGISRIFCNIHPNMAAYVVAVDTPYHGVTDGEGRFSIPAVARGSYTYHAWRPGAEELTGSVLVDAQSTLDIRWP